MSEKTTCAAGKKNMVHIRNAVRNPMLRKLREVHYAGGCLSLLNDSQLVDLAAVMTKTVMKNEDIRIILKRRK